jgi:hypothetical protein
LNKPAQITASEICCDVVPKTITWGAYSRRTLYVLAYELQSESDAYLTGTFFCPKQSARVAGFDAELDGAAADFVDAAEDALTDEDAPPVHVPKPLWHPALQ